jgi:hypothetical protein
MAHLRVHRMCALVVGSLLSLNAIAATARSKVVVLQCVPQNAIAVMVGCDRSIGVVASCPAPLTSCAQALAVFESAPDNLRFNFNGGNSGLGTSFWYTLSSNASTPLSDQR